MLSIDDITVIVKTFERPRCLRRFLVCDDSKDPYADKVLSKFLGSVRGRVFNIPYDSGVGKGKNVLLSAVETPYFLHCDDDFIFDERSDLASSLDKLLKYDLDILGGVYYDVYPLSSREVIHDLFRLKFFRIRQLWNKKGEKNTFAGNFRDREDGTVYIEPVEFSPPVTLCDITQNFFIARVEPVLNKVKGWDESIKIGGDHEDFFFRASRAGLKIAYTEPFGVIHYPERPKKYSEFRSRARWMRPRKYGQWKK